MSKYIWFAIILLIGSNVATYFYFTARLDSERAAIALKQEKIDSLTAVNTTLNTRVVFLEATTKIQDAEYDRALAAFDAYKTTAASLKPRTIVSTRTVIETVPADLVVVEVNEISNETIIRINTNANSFSSRLHDN
jgi:hypothetical protein